MLVPFAGGRDHRRWTIATTGLACRSPAFMIARGSLKPAQIGGYRRPVLEPHEALLRKLADGKDIILAEIQAELSRRVGLKPDLSTIHHYLRRLGLRRKKVAESRRAGSA